MVKPQYKIPQALDSGLGGGSEGQQVVTAMQEPSVHRQCKENATATGNSPNLRQCREVQLQCKILQITVRAGECKVLQHKTLQVTDDAEKSSCNTKLSRSQTDCREAQLKFESIHITDHVGKCNCKRKLKLTNDAGK